MKILKLVTIIFTISLIVSCGTDEPLPFVEFDGLEYGAVPRLTNGVDGNLDFFNIDGSSLAFSVEFYDEANGANVESYVWDVSYSGNPDNSARLAEYSKSDFTSNANGLPSIDIIFTFRQMLDALSLSDADIDGGEFLTLQATLTKSDGSVFTSANTGTNLVSSAAFKAFYQYRANIICPSDLGGMLDVSTVGWCGTSFTGSTELVDEGNGVYTTEDFTFGAYEACYGAGATLPGGSVTLVDACNKISFGGVDRWGESYSFNSLTIDGATMTIDWTNSYAPEAGVTILTRQDGNNWPDLGL